MRLEWTPQQAHRESTNWFLHEYNTAGLRRGVAVAYPTNVRNDIRVWEARVIMSGERKRFTDLDEAKAWAVVSVRLP